jgi:hypothetical protein
MIPHGPGRAELHSTPASFAWHIEHNCTLPTCGNQLPWARTLTSTFVYVSSRNSSVPNLTAWLTCFSLSSSWYLSQVWNSEMQPRSLVRKFAILLPSISRSESPEFVTLLISIVPVADGSAFVAPGSYLWVQKSGNVVRNLQYFCQTNKAHRFCCTYIPMHMTNPLSKVFSCSLFSFTCTTKNPLLSVALCAAYSTTLSVLPSAWFVLVLPCCWRLLTLRGWIWFCLYFQVLSLITLHL